MEVYIKSWDPQVSKPDFMDKQIEVLSRNKDKKVVVIKDISLINFLLKKNNFLGEDVVIVPRIKLLWPIQYFLTKKLLLRYIHNTFENPYDNHYIAFSAIWAGTILKNLNFCFSIIEHRGRFAVNEGLTMRERQEKLFSSKAFLYSKKNYVLSDYFKGCNNLFNNADLLPNVIDKVPLKKIKDDKSRKYKYAICSRMVKGKGIKEAIKHILLDKDKNKNVIIVGIGGELSFLLSCLKHNDIPYHYIPYLNHSDYKNIFLNVKILLSFSLFESFNLTAAEALVSGCRVIGSKVGIMHDLYKFEVIDVINDLSDENFNIKINRVKNVNEYFDKSYRA